jgi:hypothetical protein
MRDNHPGTLPGSSSRIIIQGEELNERDHDTGYRLDDDVFSLLSFNLLQSQQRITATPAVKMTVISP